jgi:general secretion pathway protein B
MSFILDALKKSETERQRADAPALYEMKMAPPRHGVAIWLIVLAALLVINVVVLSVVLLRGSHGSPQTDAAGTLATPPAAAPAPAPATAYPTVPAAANPPPAAPPTATPVAPPPVAAADTATTGNAASADAADDTPAVEPPRGNGGASGAGSGDVPSYAQAASVPGANLPELKLDLHAYATNPADRFVFLNMTRLKEGQSTPSGVRVESITPDGAILSWQGSRFFLQRQ